MRFTVLENIFPTFIRSFVFALRALKTTCMRLHVFLHLLGNQFSENSRLSLALVIFNLNYLLWLLKTNFIRTSHLNFAARDTTQRWFSAGESLCEPMSWQHERTNWTLNLDMRFHAPADGLLAVEGFCTNRIFFELWTFLLWSLKPCSLAYLQTSTGCIRMLLVL